MNIGIIGYGDWSGLGRMTRTLMEKIDAYWTHLWIPNEGKTAEWDTTPAHRTLRSPTWTPPPELVEQFVKQCDVVVAVETDYRAELAEAAKRHNTLSVLIPMYEWLGVPLRYPFFDRYLCTSRITYERCPVPADRKQYIPWPVDHDTFWGEGERHFNLPVQRVLHCAGHGGMNGRKGTVEAVKGFLMTTNPNLELIIRAQKDLGLIDPELPKLCSAPRVKVQIGNFPSSALYAGADAYLYTARLDGQAMVPQEAMAAGLLTFVTDSRPMNEYQLHPMQYLPCDLSEIKIAGQDVPWAVCRAEKIAEALEWAAHPDNQTDVFYAAMRQAPLEWDGLYEEWMEALA